MKYLELSLENVKKEINKLYKKIIKDYNYDLVIFIAKGSYIIGDELAKLNNAPLLEINATRDGNKLKKIISPLLKYIPKNIRIKLREKEMKSSYHEIKNDRKISFDESEYKKYINCKRILLVDDSIDSGNSITMTSSTIKKYFKNAELRVAVLNTMKKSFVKPDYTLYKDCMICGPWSNDSKEKKIYDEGYEILKNKSKNISVVMATYNGEKYVSNQIDSIIKQLNENDELVISDDGSTDKTTQIIKNYQKKYKNILLINGPKKGVVKNFENALINCKNDYIFLSDQDDVWEPDKKKIILEILNKDKYDIVVHDAIVIDERENIIIKSWFNYRKSKKGLINNLIKNRYLGCCIAFNKKILEKALPIPNVEMHDWWIGLISEKYFKTIFINNKLIKYRRHSQNTSSLEHYPFKKMLKNRINLIYYLIKR